MESRLRLATLILATTMVWGLAPGTGSVVSHEARSFSVETGDTVVIQNDYGRVRIAPASGSLLEVRIRRRSISDTAARARVCAEKRSDRIFIYCIYPDGPSEPVDLDIWAPGFMNVTLWGANPEVMARGLQGVAHLHSWTGDVVAENLTGAVTLISDQGDIVYRSNRQPTGDVHLETTSGTVYCELGETTIARCWIRAGGKILVGAEPHGNMLEKQFGTGGPLIHAASLRGDVHLEIKGADASPSEVPLAVTPPANFGAMSSPSRPGQTSPEQARTDRVPSGTQESQGAVPQKTVIQEPVIQASSDSQPAIDSERSLTFKVNVDWVFINVAARDRYDNRSLPYLGPEDFEIYEDGVLQEIGQYDSADAPIHLLLLLDISGSTSSFIELSKDASIKFTSEIRANDRIGAAAFNENVTFVQNFTNDRNAVALSIRRLESGGGSAFYDALLDCIDNYMRGIEGRKAIVIFTDGVDSQLTGQVGQGSRTTFESLFRRIQESDIVIYPILLDTEGRSAMAVPPSGLAGGIGSGQEIPRTDPRQAAGPGDRTAYHQAQAQLWEIADQTGGRMYIPRQIEDLARAYAEIADDLRTQYWLGYTPANRKMDGSWRQIRVKVRKHPDAEIRTRKGYYARSDSEGQRGEASTKPQVHLPP